MRGISPVVATVLMVAIAIAAAVVAYSWLMSVQSQAQAAAGETASGIGTEMARITKVQCDTSTQHYKIYMYNSGDTNVTFTNAVVIKGTDVQKTALSSNNVSEPKKISTIVVPIASCDGSEVEIRLYTEGGATITWKGKPE